MKLRFPDCLWTSIALIAGQFFCSYAAAAANPDCEGKVFGAIAHGLLSTTETANLPTQVRALRQGIWISNTGLFINEGIVDHIEVDLSTGVATAISSARKEIALPNGYEILEGNSHLAPGRQLIRKTVRLTPEQAGEVTCLANAVWSHRPNWEIEAERRSAVHLRAWRKWERLTKKLTAELKNCNRLSQKTERDRCLDAVPESPPAPPIPEIAEFHRFDPDLFAQATDVENLMVLRNDLNSREISGLGVFSGKSELLAKAIYQLFR